MSAALEAALAAKIDAIYGALDAGASPIAEAVAAGSSAWVVSWGAAGAPEIRTLPEIARELADQLEAADFAPELRRRLRLAADVADQRASAGA